MPRNEAGTYSLPAGSIVTVGETIQPSQHNPPLQDLASDANNARPVVAGGTGATSASAARSNLGVPASGDVLLKAQNLSDVASAETARTNLGLSTVAATGAYDDLTGKPTIPPELSEAQVTDPDDTTFGTVSGQGLAAAFDEREQQIGVGQTWQDVLSSRTHSTSYQNLTGKPIVVNARTGSDSTIPRWEVSVDNSTWVEVAGTSTIAASDVSFVVPDQWYYRINSGENVPVIWAELR